MAETDESQFSLLNLEEDLTCSICLSPFDCPVTTPCGHNFCRDCLLETWKGSYSCPQCRTVFAIKPELKKNTVLSTVVETFKLRSNKSEVDLLGEESKAEKEEAVRCDTCMEAEASRTCLTCMASFCDNHLRPHRENPIFRLHQLCEPVGDLQERICPDHHKLMEFFCSQHGRTVCSTCLHQVHKGCSFMSPEEQRNVKKSDLQDKLVLLDSKIEKTETVMLQMDDMQLKLKEAAAKRKAVFAAMYQQMRDMLSHEEREAQSDVDHELEIDQTKLCNLMKRLTENTATMRKATEDINGLLSQSQTLSFLQASFDLPRIVRFEPHAPRINLDSRKVTATHAFAAALREHLTEIFKEPVEARLPKLKPDEKAVLVSGSAQSQPDSVLTNPPKQKAQSTSHSPGCPPFQPFFQPIPVPVYMGQQGEWNRSWYAQASGSSKGPPKQKSKQDKKAPNPPGRNSPSAKGSNSGKKVNSKSHSSPGKSN